VVGWSDPEGTRHRIGALLLGYYTRKTASAPPALLMAPPASSYAGPRRHRGMPVAELERLYGRLQPLTGRRCRCRSHHREVVGSDHHSC
jgi:hypothetical protein